MSLTGMWCDDYILRLDYILLITILKGRWWWWWGGVPAIDIDLFSLHFLIQLWSPAEQQLISLSFNSCNPLSLPVWCGRRHESDVSDLGLVLLAPEDGPCLTVIGFLPHSSRRAGGQRAKDGNRVSQCRAIEELDLREVWGGEVQHCWDSVTTAFGVEQGGGVACEGRVRIMEGQFNSRSRRTKSHNWSQWGRRRADKKAWKDATVRAADCWMFYCTSEPAIHNRMTERCLTTSPPGYNASNLVGWKMNSTSLLRPFRRSFSIF